MRKPRPQKRLLLQMRLHYLIIPLWTGKYKVMLRMLLLFVLNKGKKFYYFNDNLGGLFRPSAPEFLFLYA
jgi:hypothetical protein